MRILYVIRKINGYRKVYKNWISVLFNIKKNENLTPVVLRGTNKDNKGICTVGCARALANLIYKYKFAPEKFYFKDGKLYYDKNEIIQDSPVLTYLSACGFIKEGDILYNPKYNVKFKKEVIFAVFDIFCLKTYSTDVKDREVVDIGANIGDSAIWFAINGAKHVYAFEPLPNVYSVAVENIKLNNLEDRITFFNAAVGLKDGEVLVPSSVNIEKSGTYSINYQGDVKVPVYSIERIRRMIKDPYLLKMDCEGCEAEIIMNFDMDFEKIIFEAHQRISKIPNKRLVSRLEEEKYKCERRSRIENGDEVFYCEKKV